MSNATAISLIDVVTILQAFAPLSLAESWDNVGLLIEPTTPREIQRILLTNDLTERVMEEALSRQSDLIIAYHPLIFNPLKHINQDDWKERVISKCLKNGVALYSPHTTWDSTHGGVNDWLVNFVPIVSSRPITPNAVDPERVGLGRIATVADPHLTLREAIKRFKRYINMDLMNVATGVGSSLDSRIRTIAVAAGDGDDVLKGVPADLYVTGAMEHHQILDAIHRNVSVIACNHSNSERGFLSVFRKRLGRDLGAGVEIVVSTSDADPLVIQ